MVLRGPESSDFYPSYDVPQLPSTTRLWALPLLLIKNAPLTHSFNNTMSDDSKLTVDTLQADGSNWVIYRECMLWAIESHGLEIHLNEAVSHKRSSTKAILITKRLKLAGIWGMQQLNE